MLGVWGVSTTQKKAEFVAWKLNFSIHQEVINMVCFQPNNLLFVGQFGKHASFPSSPEVPLPLSSPLPCDVPHFPVYQSTHKASLPYPHPTLSATITICSPSPSIFRSIPTLLHLR